MRLRQLAAEAPMRLLTGQVHSTGVNVVDLVIGGQLFTNVSYLDSWTPATGQTTKVLVQGDALLALGPVAPGTTHTAPATPTAPVAPTVTAVEATESQSFHVGPDTWGTDTRVQQGGTAEHRAFYFYGGAVQAAIGAGTLAAATLWLQRVNTAHGPAGPANIYVGTHSYTTQPGGTPTAITNGVLLGTLERGEAKVFSLPTVLVTALDGGATGVGLQSMTLGVTDPDHAIACGVSDAATCGLLTLTVT